MDSASQTDSEKLKELLKRTGEFIAYFEVAETKMMEWKQDMEQTFLQHQSQFNHQIDSLKQMSDDMSAIMTEAGAARWRIAAEENLNQGRQHLALLEQKSQQITHDIEQLHTNHKQHIASLFAKLSQQADSASTKVNDAIESFDINAFTELTQESVSQVTQVSENAVQKSEKLFSAFHIKTAMLAIVVSSLTALTIGLYLSDEMPWEIHKHAMVERDMGKAIMAAWPKLSRADRDKILRFTHTQQDTDN